MNGTTATPRCIWGTQTWSTRCPFTFPR